MGEAVYVGGIGSTQPGLSEYILECENAIHTMMRRLEGWEIRTTPEGTFEFIKPREYRYNSICRSWAEGKMREVMAKNHTLSKYNSEQEMNIQIRYIMLGICEELFYFSKEFELSSEKITELRHMLSNFTHQSARCALFESHKSFLKNTTTETTLKSQQQITEQSEKKSGLFGMFK